MLSYKPYKPVRICDSKKYWFNKDGIVESEKYNNKEIHYMQPNLFEAFNLKEIKEYVPDCPNVYDLLKRCITRLNVGDSINTLEILLKSITIGKLYLNEIDRFVTKIGKPSYERFPENKNKKTFDFIRVDVNILTNTIEPKKYIEKNYDEICNMVLEKIKNSNRFNKFGVPINFLKLEKATFIPRISVIEFLFSLKEIENVI